MRSGSSLVKKTMVPIFIIGLLLIVVASILTLVKDGGFWVNASATTSGAIGGVLIGAGITGLINLDPLQEIKGLIYDSDQKITKLLDVANRETIQNFRELREYYDDALKSIHSAKISSGGKSECRNRLQSLSSKETIYRYFETLNSSGQREWRMKKLSFSISNDKKRINSQMSYNFDDDKAFSYTVQAAYIGKHLILITEEVNDLDEPIVEVYPDLRVGGQGKTFSGISIRYPWGQQSTLLYTFSMVSEEWLLTDSAWEELSQGYWVLKASERDEGSNKLQNIWEQRRTNGQFFL